MSAPSRPEGQACQPPGSGVEPGDATRPPETAVFAQPWEAQAFAMTLTLHRRGLFSWPEWAQALASQIEQAQRRGDPDLGDTYYRHWLCALETLLAAKGVTSASELERHVQAWDRAADRTPHGQPIELRPQDFPPPD